MAAAKKPIQIVLNLFTKPAPALKLIGWGIVQQLATRRFREVFRDDQLGLADAWSTDRGSDKAANFQPVHDRARRYVFRRDAFVRKRGNTETALVDISKRRYPLIELGLPVAVDRAVVAGVDHVFANDDHCPSGRQIDDHFRVVGGVLRQQRSLRDQRTEVFRYGSLTLLTRFVIKIIDRVDVLEERLNCDRRGEFAGLD